MPISALIITLAGNADQSRLRGHLAEMPEIELGPLQGCRWPVVTETASLEQGRALVERVQALSGVSRVDVLSVNFEDVNFEELDASGPAPYECTLTDGTEHG